MSTLFTVSVSWFNKPALYEQLMFASEGDAILLIQDAVLALQSPIALASFVAKCNNAGIEVLALDDDLKMRDIDSKYAQIQTTDYQGFVELVISHDKQVAF